MEAGQFQGDTAGVGSRDPDSPLTTHPFTGLKGGEQMQKNKKKKQKQKETLATFRILRLIHFKLLNQCVSFKKYSLLK